MYGVHDEDDIPFLPSFLVSLCPCGLAESPTAKC